MKKILLLSLALVICFSALFTTSCGKKRGDDNKTYVEEGATKITIYSRDFESWYQEYMKKLVNEFNKDLTDGIQLDIKFFSESTYTSALTVARENGKAPDIFIDTYSNVYANVLAGYNEELDSYLSDAAKADLIDSCKEMVTYNDHIYAYPFYVEPGSLFFYRKDVFAKCGITSVPKTFEELYAACAKIKPTLSRGTYCMGLPLGSAECTWVTYGLQQNCTGGLVVDDTWMNSRLDNEGFKDIAEFFYTMFNNGYCPQAAVSTEGYTYIVDALCDGTLAMTYSGSWGIAEIYDYTESDEEIINNIGVAPIPTKSGNQDTTTSSNGGWCFAISKGSKHKDLAAKVMNWLFTEDTARTAGYFIAAYNSKSPTTKSVKNYLDSQTFDVPQDWVKVVNDVAAKGIPEPIFPWDVSVEFGSILEKMELYATQKTFKSAFDEALAAAKANTAEVMKRSNYTGNPKYNK